MTMISVPPELLNISDAARTACISRSKLYEFIGTGELPTVKLGKRRLVRVEALRASIASKEHRAR
jgi:excisionase family DNA binding protein